MLGVEKDVVLTPILHDTPAEIAQALDVKDWKRGECEPVPGKTMPAVTVVERDYPNLYKRFTSLGPLMSKLGNGGKGMAWNTEHEVDFLKRLNGVVTDEGPTKGLPRIESDIDAAEVILTLAPETNGEVAVKAWASLGRLHRARAHPSRHARRRTRRSASATWSRSRARSSPRRSGPGSRVEKVCYNAGYTNVHELIPWRTLTGRQQLYQDHLWMRAFGEALCVYRPPIDTRSVKPVIDTKPNGEKQIVLNFITPHQKWGIHSTYTDNLLMLTSRRGGPIVWISEKDARAAGIVDNDWIEAYNSNGALVARAVVSQRVKQGMCMMYHAQEKIVNVPGSEMTGQRGGIHNSVTRIVVKPTHMIGGYAQQSYGFNYYGTIGTNRDEFVIVRKMAKVDWLDRPLADEPPVHRAHDGGRRMKIRAQIAHGAEPRQVHRVSHLLRHLQERLDQPRGHGIRVVQQRRDQARHRLSQGLGEPGRAGTAAGCASATARSSRKHRRQVARARQDLRQPRPARDRRLLRALHLRLRAPAEGARDCRRCRPRGRAR